MIHDVFHIDNFLDDPCKLIDLSKKITYYCNEFSPHENANLEQDIRYRPEGRWRGYRSRPLFLDMGEDYKVLHKEIMDKLFRKLYVRTNVNMASFMHYIPKLPVDEVNTLHTDPGVYSSVLYLNQNPPPDSGTVVFDRNGRKIIVENKFNRIVFFRSRLDHAIQSSFGRDVNNSRLTLTSFIYGLTLDFIANAK